MNKFRYIALIAGICVAVLAGMWAERNVFNQDKSVLERGAKETPTAARETEETTTIIPDYHAIIIGINDYRYAPPTGWNDLKTSEKDAAAVANLLEQEYGFNVQRLLGKDATRAAIISALDGLSDYTEQDAVLIYYAGHGYYDDDLGEGFWIPYDAKNITGNKRAKQDWVWNSVITKMIAASQARHVLVVADACYGGSLFRGDEGTIQPREMEWYLRALTKPSRYLITSGDLEKVLDSGARHSIFAQMLLNFLSYSDSPVFSASEVGLALRNKVGEMTGQMVRMGPLHVATDAGGEFIFVKQSPELYDAISKKAASKDILPSQTPTQQTAISNEPEILSDVALLNFRGADKTAHKLVRQLNCEDTNTIAHSIAQYIDPHSKTERLAQTSYLIEQLKQSSLSQQPSQAPSLGQPRVVAVIGPTISNGNVTDEATADLFRIGLMSALNQDSSMYVVERECLTDVLRELDIGISDLSDERARRTIGKWLPASTILYGKLIADTNDTIVLLRLVDTESSAVSYMISTNLTSKHDILSAPQTIAKDMNYQLRKLYPLTGNVLTYNGDTLTVDIGRFQGLKQNMLFSVLPDNPSNEQMLKPLGTAKVVEILNDNQSRCIVTWNTIPPEDDQLWIREIADGK